MTRKKYIQNVQRLALAIYHDQHSLYPPGHVIGNTLKNIKYDPLSAIKLYGSYQSAWDSLKWARIRYLGEE